MNLELLLNEVVSLTEETARWIEKEKSAANVDVDLKFLNNLVTNVDKGSEERLVEGLSLLLPEAGFIAEEGTSDKKGDVYNWIIDPIDGTTNFIHGIPVYAISIALYENNQPVIGVVYDVARKECFKAFKGSGLLINNNVSKVSSTDKVQNSLVATGFPYHNFDRFKGYLETFEFFARNTRGIRRAGAAAIDLAYVAAGRFDMFFEYALNPWDIAAGAFLIQEAGGKVSDFSLGDTYHSGVEIAASNGILHEELIKACKPLS